MAGPKDDFLDVTLSTGDVLPPSYLAGIQTLLSPLDRTAAEIAASVTPVNYQHPGDFVYDLRRAGLVPNSTGARAANTAAAQALLDPTTNGPRGRFVFSNTTGADTYYFSAGIIPIRDRCHLDLAGCTLDFAGSSVSAHNSAGFLYAIRDVSIGNGSINVDYDGTGGENRGQAIRLGNREDAGDHFNFGFEEDLSERMGRCRLYDLKITSNNPAVAAPIALIGGLKDVVCENISIDGGGVHTHAIYHEFGFWSDNSSGSAGDWTSAHSGGLVFRNISGKNLKTATSEGAVVGVVGSNGVEMESIHGDGCWSVVEIRPGEALFWRVSPEDSNHGVATLRNIAGRNVAGIAVQLIGSEDASAGYLSGESLTESEQVDLISFSLDGFDIEADGAGVYLAGVSTVKNGVIKGDCSSGKIIITDECMKFDIDGVTAIDGDGLGIRASFGGAIWNTPRLKSGQIRNCKISGNTGAGISIDNCQSVTIANNQIGKATIYDGAAESTQTSGVALGNNANGVVCDGNYVATSGGAEAYSSSATGDRGNDIRTPRGLNTVSGNWKRDGIAIASASQLADIADTINVADKYLHKTVIENSNNRLYFALGSAAGDGWRLVDGSATVTPA